MNSIDEKYILRCIQIAQNACGYTYPNPMVGSVVVHDGKIIGEGFHRKAGTPHAEVHAINSVKDKELLKSSTLYVCLEPCAHYGLTPPCAELIIRMGIPRVVVGCVDSFSKVSGKGIEMMRKAGIEVEVGVCEDESRWLNRRFFTFHEQKRPYVILKWAESGDGFLSPTSNTEPVWLTGEQCRRRVHQLRSHEQAIMVGVNTIIADNPQLTSRAWHGVSPIRIVVDPNLRTPATARVITDGKPTIFLNQKRNDSAANITYKLTNLTGSASASNICTALHELGIQSVVIEGGSATLAAFINANIWDEAYVYHSPILLHNGVAAPTFNNAPTAVEVLDDIILKEYIRTR